MTQADPLELITLLQISDTAFPSGAFAFSGGLETLVTEGRLRGPDDLYDVLAEQVVPRWMTFDRWFLASAMEGTDAALPAIDTMCEVQTPIGALASASTRMGRSLLSAHARTGLAPAESYLRRLRAGEVFGHAAVVQGMLARHLGLPVHLAQIGALHGALAGMTAAAVRLGAVGALQGQSVLSRLRPLMAEGVAQDLSDRPHAFAPIADIAAIRHAGAATRLFSN